jgi:hypothetical protein
LRTVHGHKQERGLRPFRIAQVDNISRVGR